jgi:replicative DNA helicase
MTGGRQDSRTLEVGDVARGLKALAKDVGCTVIGLCQLNRQVEGRDSKMPRLADLRDSGEVEQEADGVVFLWTKSEDLTAPFLPVEFYLAKNRHGALRRETRTFNRPALGFEEGVR